MADFIIAAKRAVRNSEFVMDFFTLFVSVFFFADGISFAQVDWSADDGSLFGTGSGPPVLDVPVGSLSLESSSNSGALLDDLGIFAPGEDPFNFDDDVDSMFLAGSTKNDCGSNTGLFRGKLRARDSCAVDQKPKASQEDRESQLGGGIFDSDKPKDSTLPRPILDGIPLVDFRSVDRNFGYCPTVFYDALSLPVCASDDPSHIRKSFGVYYSLNYAMLGMITFHQFTDQPDYPSRNEPGLERADGPAQEPI
jgi:hypothetical protein